MDESGEAAQLTTGSGESRPDPSVAFARLRRLLGDSYQTKQRSWRVEYLPDRAALICEQEPKDSQDLSRATTVVIDVDALLDWLLEASTIAALPPLHGMPEKKEENGWRSINQEGHWPTPTSPRTGRRYLFFAQSYTAPFLGMLTAVHDRIVTDSAADAHGNWAARIYHVLTHGAGPAEGSVAAERAWLLTELRRHRNLILEGVAGSGKSFSLEDEGFRGSFASTDWVVFHPATSYEDFVEGLRPEGDAFSYTEGRFLEACIRSAGRPEQEHLFVIDEINRANAARVLGDLLYCIEPGKRTQAEDAAAILASRAETRDPSWPAGVARLGLPNEGVRGWICVPDNLYIMGTMNTTDRSVGSIDLALRRRFTFIRQPLLPADVLSREVPDLAESAQAWERLNTALEDKIGPDAQLGHSYFYSASKMGTGAQERTGVLWQRLLLPQLVEILAAFNAFKHADHLLAAVEGGGIRWSPPYWLKVVGEGLDKYALVVRNEAQPSKGPSGTTAGQEAGDQDGSPIEAAHTRQRAAGPAEADGGEDAGEGDS